ncbi:MAG TPA: hypothetical protein VKA68_06955 [bacterium]|nr:hypothetical protein [bacterium]
MFGLHYLDIIVIGIFFGIIILIGWIANRVMKEGEEGFFLGGRTFGKLVSIFLAFGAGTNSDTAVVASRETYRSGMSGVWSMLLWLFVTPFYWIIAPWYRRLRVVTIGDYFEERFRSRGLAMGYVLVGLLWLMTYAAIGFTAIGKTIESVTIKSESACTVSERQRVRQYEEFERLSRREESLTPTEQQRLDELARKAEQGQIRQNYSFITSRQAVPVIGLIVIIYGVLGGLAAAAWTDTLQGILIVVMTFLLLPSALSAVGWFSGLHEAVPAHMFQLLGSVETSEYTWYYVVALVAINLTGIVVQPHIVAVGGGGAKDVLSARIGLVVGNFMKRFSTAVWGLTGILAFALFSEAIEDPDLVWGYATQQLLAPGLVGLMIAALIAASMSSADVFMLSGSALFTRNLYKPLIPNKGDRHYVYVGRVVSVVIIIGAVLLSLYFNNILDLLQYYWQIPVIFGAAFWLSIFWRRITRAAAGVAVVYSALMIVFLPVLLPGLTNIEDNQDLLLFTRPRQIQVETGATRQDVEAGRADQVGESITVTRELEPAPVLFEDIIEVQDESGTHRRGVGPIDPNLLVLHVIGVDLSAYSRPSLMTLSFFMDVIGPFLLLLLISPFTRPPSSEKVARFFARFHTPVQPDPEVDRKEVEKSYRNPRRFEHRKFFPGSNWEFRKPDRITLLGFLACIGGIGVILGFTYFIANLQIP